MAGMLLSTVSFGQHVGIGVTAAGGASWLSKSSNTIQSSSPAVSLNIGLTFAYITKGKIGFSGDVVYSNEGVKQKGEYTNVTSTTTYTSEYIRIPLRFTYYFIQYGTNNKIRPMVSIGPSFGILTGGRMYQTFSDNTVVRQQVKDIANPLDIGVQASGGLSFMIGHNMLFNSYVSYYQGLTQQNKVGDEKMKNGNIMLNASMTFNLKKTGSKY